MCVALNLKLLTGPLSKHKFRQWLMVPILVPLLGEKIIVREGGYLSRSVKAASRVSWRIVRGFTSNGGSSNQIKKHWFSFLSSHGPHFGSGIGEEIIVREGDKPIAKCEISPSYELANRSWIYQ